MTVEQLYDKLGDLIGNGFGKVELEISVDVSTNDEDADHRIFAKPLELITSFNNDCVLLCEKTSDNFSKDK